MASKIALIFAVACVAQGFASDISPSVPSQVSEDIQHNLEEAFQGMDEVRETVSMAAIHSYLKRQNIKVVIACFGEQRENYENLGKYIEELMDRALEDVAREIGEKFEEYRELATEPIRNIATVLRELPGRTWELINEEGFKQALQYMRESRRVVEENSQKLGQVINQIGQEFPEVARRATEMVREIRNEARKESEAIASAIEKCIEQGGPQN